MNIKRSLLALCSTLVLFLAMAPSAFAQKVHTPSEEELSSISSQMLDFLDEIDLSRLNGERKVFVDFMVNAKAEILVLSTNDKDFDDVIKSKLNYKKLSEHSLEIDRVYTIPVLFQGYITHI